MPDHFTQTTARASVRDDETSGMDGAVDDENSCNRDGSLENLIEAGFAGQQQSNQRLLQHTEDHTPSTHRSCHIITQAIQSSFCQDSRYLLKRAVPLAGSLAFCWQIFLVGVLGSWLNDSHDSEFNAAINWIQTFMATCLALALSPLTGINYPTSMHLAQINEIAFSDDHQDSNTAINEIGFRLHSDQRVDLSCLEAIRDPVNNLRSIFHAGLALSPLLMVLGGLPLYYAEFILQDGFAQSPQTANLAQSFLRPYSLALVGLTLRTAFEQFLFANQYYKQTISMSLLGLAIGTGVAAFLGYGPWDMGLEGVAIGYAIEAWLTAAMMGIYVTQSDDLEPFHLFKQFDVRQTLTYGLGQLSRYGLTQTATDIFELGATFGYSALTSTVSADAEAGWQAVMQLPFLTFPLIAGIGIVGGQTMEHLRGKTPSSDIKRIHWHNTLVLTGLTTALSAGAIGLIGYYPEKTLGHYDDAVKAQLPELISIIAAGHLFDALRYQQLQACKGMGDNVSASGASIFGLLIGVGMASIISQNDKTLGAEGTAIAYTLGMFLSWVSLAYLWYSAILDYPDESVIHQRRARLDDGNCGETRRPSFTSATDPDEQSPHQYQLIASDLWQQDQPGLDNYSTQNLTVLQLTS